MGRAAAEAVGARTARACDGCLRRRARWYCATDDAFLCQPCDRSVHSANRPACRHERVALKTASTSSTFEVGVDRDGGRDPAAPPWHRDMKRKARTPRNHRQATGAERPQRRMYPSVPDLEERPVDDDDDDKMEDDLIYRVPIFDPDLAEPFDDGFNGGAWTKPLGAPTPVEGFLPPDVDTAADFALDVETLLGRGLDRESFCMDDLGFSGPEDGVHPCRASMGVSNVKKEEDAVLDENVAFAGTEPDPSDDTFDINFDCCSPTAEEGSEGLDGKRKRLMLRLDYESIINDWPTWMSPWVDDDGPRRFDPCWLGNTEMMLEGGGNAGMEGGAHTAAEVVTTDVGREARVSRYREKRRTRLFSKKIRYEVRKLNAEKRPRMKGRFVKRASFAATAPIGAAATPPPFVF